MNFTKYGKTLQNSADWQDSKNSLFSFYKTEGVFFGQFTKMNLFFRVWPGTGHHQKDRMLSLGDSDQNGPVMIPVFSGTSG